VRTVLARIPRVQLTSFPERHQTVVCTKHLLRLDLATARISAVARAESAGAPRPRNSSVPSCWPTHYDGLRRAAPVPVRSQLGRGAAHSSRSRREAAVTVERARESNHHAELRDLRGPDATARSGPQRGERHPAWSPQGSVRRRALPCPSSAFSRRPCSASIPPCPRPMSEISSVDGSISGVLR
jgi:hypothetical protein